MLKGRQTNTCLSPSCSSGRRGEQYGKVWNVSIFKFLTCLMKSIEKMHSMVKIKYMFLLTVVLNVDCLTGILMTADFFCFLREKKEEESEDTARQVLDDEDPPFQDDLNDLTFQPQTQRYTCLEQSTLLSAESVKYSSKWFVSLLLVAWKRKIVLAVMKMFPIQTT